MRTQDKAGKQKDGDDNVPEPDVQSNLEHEQEPVNAGLVHHRGGKPVITPRVLNRKNGFPKGAIYVGRPSVWGNPYVIGKDGTRKEVIAQYAVYFYASKKLLARIEELRGKDLVCWCAPLDCHASILLAEANK